jgi:thymidylate kinase
MREVAAGLRRTLREHVLQLADISQSPTGRRLHEVYHADELFGKRSGNATAISRCLAAAADLFYFDGALIGPLEAPGRVVLKERHVDTLLSHEGPVLTIRYGWPEQRALEWLSCVIAPLQVRPALTILVEAPEADRERRLRERTERAGRRLEPTEAELNRAVFRTRADWYERLRLRDRKRWVSIANPDGELSTAVSQVIAEVLNRQAVSSRTSSQGR